MTAYQPADRAETIPALLARNAAGKPAAAAIGDGVATHDWAWLDKRSKMLAANLSGQGVGPGDSVAVRLPNSPDHLALLCAIARLGAVTVHINTRFGPNEIRDVLTRSGAKLFVTCARAGTVDLSSSLTAIDWRALPELQRVLFLDDPVTLAGVTVQRLSTAASMVFVDAARPELPCLMYTSSGTTSTPKLVVHDHASIAGHATEVACRIGLDRPGARLLAVMPFCGTFGNVAVMAALAGGAETICMSVYDAPRAAALIREREVTHLFADDSMVGALADLAGGAPYTSMRFSAVAAFHPDAVSSIERGIAAGLKPHSIYGSSEVQALFALAPQTGGEQTAVSPVSEAADIRYRIDPPSGQVASDGEGELLLRGPSTFSHYHGDPDRTAAARDIEGFFATGDLAVGGPRAFLFEARLGDVLRLGGFLVNPQEIEDFIQAESGVAAAQVVACAHNGRNVAIAFVIARDGAVPIEAELIAACRASLARYKVPARILVVDRFPSIAGPNGVKIQRGRLREMAEAALLGSPAATGAAPAASPSMEKTA